MEGRLKGLVQAEGDSVVTPQRHLWAVICSELIMELIYILEIPGHVEMQE